jgi:hypothetical protein
MDSDWLNVAGRVSNDTLPATTARASRWEALQQLRVLRHLFPGEELQRHSAAKRGILRLAYPAHAN